MNQIRLGVFAPDFFELARKTSFKRIEASAGGLSLFSQGLNPTESVNLLHSSRNFKAKDFR
jgi:hypothetical protein